MLREVVVPGGKERKGKERKGKEQEQEKNIMSTYT
jgi:hypothetical protein